MKAGGQRYQEEFTQHLQLVELVNKKPNSFSCVFVYMYMYMHEYDYHNY